MTAPLHPRRVVATLEHVEDHGVSGGVLLNPDQQATCIAALGLIQKIQARAGITSQLADGVAHARSVLDYVKSQIRRK